MDRDQLTPHFTLAELSHTEVRQFQKSNLQKASHQPIRAKLERLANELLEPIRDLCGDRPLVVHSGFRSTALNSYIGGSRTSQHCLAEACDFHIAGMDLRAVFALIRRSKLKWGQLILEDGDGDGVPTWIHVSLPRGHARDGEALLFDGEGYSVAPPLS